MNQFMNDVRYHQTCLATTHLSAPTTT